MALPTLTASNVGAHSAHEGTSRLCEPPGSSAEQPEGGAPVLHAVAAAPEQMADGWPVSTLQAEGIDPARIGAMLREVEAGDYTKLDGILIARHGRLVLEAYFNGFDRETRHDTRSAFKSVTSTLAGIAIDRGIVADLEQPVAGYFAEYWPGIKADPDKKGRISLAHLLTMTTGFDAEENWGIGPFREDDMWDSADWVRFSLDLPMAHEPGTQFSYNSSASFLLGEAVSRAAGEPLPAFAKRHLFEPLGITHYCWTVTGKGRAVAQGSFFMRPRDMLKLGQLFLDRGVWRGRRIVSEDWVTVATRRHVEAAPPDPKRRVPTSRGYGYHWWVNAVRPGEDYRTGRFFASGNGGQRIFVLPDLDMVVVFTGSHFNNPLGHEQPRRILSGSIFPAVAD